jgi:predicted nuclease with TOPRIM domain
MNNRSFQERIQELQKIGRQLSILTEDCRKKEEAAKQAKKELDKLKSRFEHCEADLIGDLFNGCFNHQMIQINPSLWEKSKCLRQKES